MIQQTYIYDWAYEIIQGQTWIYMFSLNAENDTVCLQFSNFSPYFYIELPETDVNGRLIEWNPSQVNALNVILNRKFLRYPVTCELKIRKKLYYAQSRYFKYVLCTCSTNQEFNKLRYKINSPVYIPSIGEVQLKEFESSVSPILQFACEYNLPMSGWVEYEIESIVKKTNCKYDYLIRDISSSSQPPDSTPSPMVLSFDIEVYSGIKNSFPDASRKGDVIFQISCVFWQQKTKIRPYLLSIGDIDPKIVEEDYKIKSYSTEYDLLIGFMDLVHQYNPQIITGWNILGFDIHYMIERMKIHLLNDSFSRLGMICEKECVELNESWSSSAYGKQTFKYYDWNGRIILDLLCFARREIKSENYKLETIASQFIQAHKDPITVADIFQGYEQGVLNPSKKGIQKLSLVGKYCVQDSILVQRLFDEFDMWIGVTEMSSVCNVPASYLYTKGQQVKVFSQVYRYCHTQKIVVEQNVFECAENERYQGAYVRDPIPGIYEYVIPYDFSSLYPSIIIAYNIDYSTFVDDRYGKSKIPDDKCHVIEWSEEHVYDLFKCPKCDQDTRGERTETHLKWLSGYQIPNLKCENCLHEFHVVIQNSSSIPLDDRIKIRKDKFQLPSAIFKDNYRYRFLKEPKGVLPSIAENLLNARKQTKKQMKQLDKSNQNFMNILNKRQLSYKVSCNSLYGALGVKKGMLPLMPAAMCVTAIGRSSVQKAAQTLQDSYHATIVYGDTDSVYVQFKEVPTDKLWNHARQVSKQIYNSDVFPKPMSLEFEEAIYDPFFILTKKRYMWKYFLEDGSRTDKIGNKGVILARRGTSAFLKKIYEMTVYAIFQKQSKYSILNMIIEYLNQCCTGSLPYADFIITKKVGDIESYDETRSLPAHVRLAELIQQRGGMVEVGQRLEYVVTIKGGVKAKVSDKVEDIDYQKKYSNLIPIEYLYYIHLCSKQIDELLEVAFNVSNFVEYQYIYRLQKSEYLKELKEYFRPRLVFQD